MSIRATFTNTLDSSWKLDILDSPYDKLIIIIYEPASYEFYKLSVVGRDWLSPVVDEFAYGC